MDREKQIYGSKKINLDMSNYCRIFVQINY